MLRVELKAEETLDDSDADKLAARMLDDSSYETLLAEECAVYRPDGTLLARLCKGRVPLPVCQAAYENLRHAAVKTENRGYASGLVSEAKPSRRLRSALVQLPGENLRRRYLKKDGTISKNGYADLVLSGIVGYFDRNTRFPFCRQTAFNQEFPEKFSAAVPFIRAVDAVFAAEVPDRYAAQKAVAEASSRDFLIADTAFSTVTVNKNWQTAVHKDKGDLAAGFGVLSVLRAGLYSGGLLVLPKYRVAFDLMTSDVLLYDVHEWHGNTPLCGERGAFERLSCVFYYRERIKFCGTAEQEAEFAKNREPGTPLLRARPGRPGEGP